MRKRHDTKERTYGTLDQLLRLLNKEYEMSKEASNGKINKLKHNFSVKKVKTKEELDLQRKDKNKHEQKLPESEKEK